MDRASFERIAELLRARAGLIFPACRWADLEMGARRAMARAGVESAHAYLDAISSGRIDMEGLVAEVTVRETHFFRDAGQLSFARREVLPRIQRERGLDHLVQVWSAGCATGEEPYTMTIVLEEDGLGDRSRVLGTDLCRSALTTARDTRYGSWSFRGVDEGVIRRHFVRDDRSQRVLSDHLRRRVTFEPHNLLAGPFPPAALGGATADLILCRNVLIYLDPRVIDAVAAGLFASLSHGGWLIAGPSDPALGAAAPFETVVTDEGVFYRRPDAAPSRSPERPARPLAVREAAAAPAASAAVARTSALLPRAVDEDARSAYAAGEWFHLVEIASRPGASAVVCALGVHAAANALGLAEAERLCAALIARHPVSTELHYLHALLCWDLGRGEEAVAAVKRALFLDRSCVVAHFLLASLLRARGDLAGASRAYRNARDVSALRPREEPVPLGDGERAGRLADASEAHLRTLAEAP